MGCGFGCLHGKYRIQEEYTLSGPVFKVAVLLYLYPQITLYLLIYVFQGGWGRNPVGNRKGESVCLVGPVVRILSKNDNFYIAQRC